MLREVVMAHDEALEAHIAGVLAGQPGMVSKKMFGGVAFLVHGNMAVGVHKDMLMVRVGPDGYDQAMGEPHTSQFDLTGRVMKGWVTVAADGIADQADLERWVKTGLDFALTLPPK
jgi:TfoX/Sxy family transcriptional regulator of competence genes